MGKRVRLLVILSVAFLIFFVFLSQNSVSQIPFSEKFVSQEMLFQNNLDCIYDSHCLDGFLCIQNECISQEIVLSCKQSSLSTHSFLLGVGDPLNAYKRLLSENDLPYLLGNGRFFGISEDNLTNFEYRVDLIIGNNTLEQGSEGWFIQLNDEPIYTLRILFSNGIDFTNRNFYGQPLSVFGREYIISEESTSSRVLLISGNKKIALEYGEKAYIENHLATFDDTLVSFLYDQKGNIVAIDVLFIPFNTGKDKLLPTESYNNPIFNNLSLSFEILNQNNLPEVVFKGGNCG